MEVKARHRAWPSAPTTPPVSTSTPTRGTSSPRWRPPLAAIEQASGVWPPDPDQFEGQCYSDADRDLLSRRCTPHPGVTLTQPLHLEHSPRAVPTAYVHCLQDTPELDAGTADLARRHGWQVVDLDCGHWPMLTTPRMLADTLLATAV